MKKWMAVMVLVVVSQGASASPLKLSCGAEYVGGTEFPASRSASAEIEGQKEGQIRLTVKDRFESYDVIVLFERQTGASYRLHMTVGRDSNNPAFQTAAEIVADGPKTSVLSSKWYPEQGSPLNVNCRLVK